MVYTSYAALSAAEVEGVDYARTTVPVTGATWTCIAIHGGGIEAGSGEAARAVASGLMDHYEFAGIKASNNGDLHITSTLFDEPNAVALVAASRRTLSLHGFTGDDGVAVTAIGGLDTVVRDRVRAALEAAGFAVTSAPSEIAGTDPANICNENASSAGVQLELSRAQRAAFFPGGDLSRAMRDSGQRTTAFYAYVAAVRSAFDGRGMVSLGSINVSRWATVPYASEDLDIRATAATGVLAAGGPHFLHLAGRVVDVNNCYLLRLACNADQTITLTLRRRLGGTETLLATGATSLLHAADTRYGLRLQITGSVLRGRIWLAARPEPDTWTVTTTDTALAAPGAVGMRSILSTANTNSLPVIASWDGFEQISPQIMTAIRSVNGVTKSHGAGADVRLADPAIIPL